MLDKYILSLILTVIIGPLVGYYVSKWKTRNEVEKRFGYRLGTIELAGARASWPLDAYGRTLHPGFTRDKTLDGTDYEDPAIPASSEIVATLDANAALRATQIVVDVTQGEPLIAGQYLGIANYLHLITHVVDVVGTVQTVGIAPTLRSAALAGATVLVSSTPVVDGQLPANTTTWFTAA